VTILYVPLRARPSFWADMMDGCASRTDTLLVLVDDRDIADMDHADLPGELSGERSGEADTADVLSTATMTSGQRNSQDLCSAKGSFRRDYELTGDVLGVGMCGAVVTAVNKRSGQKVAVKTFKLEELTRRLITFN
jgi:hypothetical protein